MTQSDGPSFPYSAGVLFGLGLGGFFDGIVLHQILQWHHMLTSAGDGRACPHCGGTGRVVETVGDT